MNFNALYGQELKGNSKKVSYMEARNSLTWSYVYLPSLKLKRF